jgi:hypothetical protein
LGREQQSEGSGVTTVTTITAAGVDSKEQLPGSRGAHHAAQARGYSPFISVADRPPCSVHSVQSQLFPCHISPAGRLLCAVQ